MFASSTLPMQTIQDDHKREQFVSLISWAGLVVALLLLFQALFAWVEFGLADADLTATWWLPWIGGTTPYIFSGILSGLVLITSVGLLLRYNWARFSFIFLSALMACILGAFAINAFMNWQFTPLAEHFWHGFSRYFISQNILIGCLLTVAAGCMVILIKKFTSKEYKSLFC